MRKCTNRKYWCWSCVCLFTARCLSKNCRNIKSVWALPSEAARIDNRWVELRKLAWRETAAGKSANQAILADSAPLSQYEIILVTIDCSFVKWCEEGWINPLSHITTGSQEQLAHLNVAFGGRFYHSKSLKKFSKKFSKKYSKKYSTFWVLFWVLKKVLEKVLLLNIAQKSAQKSSQKSTQNFEYFSEYSKNCSEKYSKKG